jgi:hypothetical protein
MAKSTKGIGAYSWYLWMVGGLMIFNGAAGLTHSANMLYPALVLTGLVALVGLGIGIWGGLKWAIQRR